MQVESTLEHVMITLCHELTHIVHQRLSDAHLLGSRRSTSSFWKASAQTWTEECRERFQTINEESHGEQFLKMMQRMWGLGSDWYFKAPPYRGVAPEDRGVAPEDGADMRLITVTPLFLQFSSKELLAAEPPTKESSTVLTVTTLNQEAKRRIDARMAVAADMGVVVYTINRVVTTCLVRHTRNLITSCWEGCEDIKPRDASGWKRCWQRKALKTHPDKGGSSADFERVTTCRNLIERNLIENTTTEMLAERSELK